MPLALRRFLSRALLLPLFGACAPAQPPGRAEAPYPPERPPAVGDILHLPTGHYVTEAQMLSAAADARIVYVGETHDNPASHRLELSVLRALADAWPGGVALGMEMFTPAQQEALDGWVSGALSEKEFLKASRWYTTWRMDFDYYRELLLFARERRIPVLGLNAEKDLVRAVGQTDFPELSEEERRRLPEMDLTDPYQRALTKAIFGGHGAGSAGQEGFLRVQTLWDETMAENAARYLQSPAGEDMRLVVVAGGNHVRYGFGIPRRLFRRHPASYLLIGGHELEVPPEKQDRLMNVTIPSFPLIPYDFVAYMAYEDLGKSEVKLGVMFDEIEGRVQVKQVLPGSAAETAGVVPGDILLSLDGEPIAETFDLVYAVKQRRPGDRGTLGLERDGKPMELEVTFQAPAAPAGHHPRK